ncbi:MAG: type II toxin-antitoxin system HicB family antitoxin [Candidatus Abawacabacteria bacterium]|nr:type II toxin-antitoxin system HicB family antitoxin [Candidatus Abawacabacteria bacterium]
MSYLAVFTQEKDGRFSALVPALPGCFSEGNDLASAKANIKEAIELYLEDEQINTPPPEMQLVASIDIES